MTITEIRQRLANKNLDALIVTHNNRFLGQDILPQEHKLQHLCGFSGSAGALIISRDKAWLFVDGRYELQAAAEVDTAQIEIIHEPPYTNNLFNFLRNKGLTEIAFDAWCLSVAEFENITRRYKEMRLTDVGDWLNLDTDTPVAVLSRDVRYAGQSREQKCQIVANMLWEKNADYLLLTAADSVSWLCNIYARDLPYTPIVRAYAVISLHGEVTLYGSNLQSTDVPTKSWDDLLDFLHASAGHTILYDAHTTPQCLKQAASAETDLIKTPDICQLLKAEKNPTELQGMINCHIRDGVALCKLLCWLEQQPLGLTELDVVTKLHQFRAEQADFFSESFATIAGFGSNAAIVHYQPTPQTNKSLADGNLLLLDSGGQYLDGTTDVTRTIPIGTASDEMITDFTQVLKAHIALARSRFPQNTSGMKLDVLARAQMWQRGLDYKHGTGHGVACFGNVHEGPQSISVGGSPYGLKPNMVVSDEPGVYKENAYGIRIENLLYTRAADLPDAPDFLEFVVLTKVPIDKRLINVYLLEQGELEWLNAYHQQVYKDIAPYLSGDEQRWLQKACSPL